MDATAVESLTAMPLGAAVSNSNTNLSCGSSSSSSNSSGYASATTTPTNPASAGSSSSHSQYSDSHSSTPVGMVEPTPVATIAAVTPYYNETIQQQQPHHVQRQHQYPPHQQYPHQTHSYQLTEHLQSPTALSTSSVPQYNSTYDSYTYLGGGESYPQSIGVERNLLGMRHTTAFYTALDKPSKTATQASMQLHSQIANSDNNGHAYGSSNSESIPNNQKRSSEASTSAKPQAAATPFYAHPLQTSGSTAYLDPYKHKLPAKLPNHNIDYVNYSNQPVDATNAVTYAQNFSQFHSAKALQQDVSYGASSSQMKPLGAVTSARIPQQRVGMHYGSTGMPVGVTIGNATSNIGSHGGGGTYIDKFDKYLYSAVTTAAQSAFYTTTQPTNLSAMPYNAVTFASAAAAPTTVPPQYAAEIPNDAHRKTSPSTSWHWSMDYGNGNCRSLPPPPSGIPTATIPPSNASYVPANATVVANRDMYYTPEKYSSKYDKYNSCYNPHQPYMAANASGRSVWSNSPHNSSHFIPTLADRLPHSYSHHATLPPNGVPNALAPTTHPSLAFHHPYPPNAGPVVARQNCCSQPYQQQNCYYPRTTHHPHFIPSTYNPHAQTTPFGTAGTANGSSNNNPAAKYGMTKVTTNDLYTATPTYDNSNMNYHSYAAGVSHNQQYSSSVAPTAVVSHQPLNPNIASGSPSDISTAYYNDLNMQASYDTYMSSIQAPTLLQHRRESLVQRVEHLPNLPPPYVQSSQAKSALIDFSKSSTTANEDSFMSETTLTNLDEHMATNMHHYHNNFGLDSGDMHASDVSMYIKAASDESTEKTGTPTTPTTKTYSSLRDFLSTWNEDEEDFSCTEERKVSENESLLVLGQSTSAEDSSNRAVVSNKIPCELVSQSPADLAVYYASDSGHLHPAVEETLVENNIPYKEERPEIHVGIAADRSADIESNQCPSINLPDIIIDIEKSNGAVPALSSAAKITALDTTVKSDLKDLSYDTFDVEKELDELETKRIKLSRKNSDIAPIRTGSVIMSTETKTHQSPPDAALEKVIQNSAGKIESISTMEDFALINTSPNAVTIEKHEENSISLACKSELASTTVQAKPENAYDKGNDSDNTTSSNGSTFEKEYETFINKIGNEYEFQPPATNESNAGVVDMQLDTPNILTNPETMTNTLKPKEEEVSHAESMSKTFIKESSQSDLEIAQKIKSFSKFYKRKRKYSEIIKDDANNKVHDNAQDKDKHTNFPIAYIKRCRKRIEHTMLLKTKQAKRAKTLSFHQKVLRSSRRYHIIRSKRLNTTKLIQQHVAKKMESNLPLIKRNNMKKLSYKSDKVSKCFNPKTLKCQIIRFINSEEFRNNLINCAAYTNELTMHKVKKKIQEDKAEIPIEILTTTTDIQHSLQNLENESMDKYRATKITAKEGLWVEHQIKIHEDFEENAATAELHNTLTVKVNEDKESTVKEEPPNVQSFESHEEILYPECTEKKASHNDVEEDEIPRMSEKQNYKSNEKQEKQVAADEFLKTNSSKHFVKDILHSKGDENATDVEDLESIVSDHTISTQEDNTAIDNETKTELTSSKVVDTSLDKSISSSMKRLEQQFHEDAEVKNGESKVVNRTFTSVLNENRVKPPAENLENLSETFNNTTAEVAIEKSIGVEVEMDVQFQRNEEENAKKCSREYPEEHSIHSLSDVEIFENKENEVMNLTYRSKDEETWLNPIKKCIDLITEDSPEKYTSHLGAANGLVNHKENINGISLNSREELLQNSEINESTSAAVFYNKEFEIESLISPQKDEEPELSQSNEEKDQFLQSRPDILSPHSKVFNSTNIELFESVDSNDRAFLLKNNEIELTETQDSREKPCLHAEPTSAASVEIFDNKETDIMEPSYSSKDEETRFNQIEENMNQSSEDSAHTEKFNKSPVTKNDKIEDIESEISDMSNITKNSHFESLPPGQTGYVFRDMDLYETENSVDMFGARKSAEYFTASSKNYFKKSDDFDESSTDSSSSSSSDSSTSSSDHRSTASSSSSSSDEDTQSSTTTAHTDFDEMKELEKELSQHQIYESSIVQGKENEMNADAGVRDYGNDESHDISEKAVTENDIRTLKKILESDSDGNEEVKTNLKSAQENSVENVMVHCEAMTIVSEHEKVEERCAIVENDDLMQDEDSIVFIGETDVSKLISKHDCAGSQLVNALVGVGESSGEGRVPRLKKILLDFLGRENSIEDYSMIDRTEDQLNSKIPKLSDLCKNALSSSFEIDTTINTNRNVPEQLERELSVEEALAEMYRQAGVASDPEDGDAVENEAQDVVLINLEEILVNDSDLYVLQCDMNENVLSVVAHAQAVDMSMSIDDGVGNFALRDESDEAVRDVAQLANTQEKLKVTNEMTNIFEPFDNTDLSVSLTNNETELPYNTPPHSLRPEFVEESNIITLKQPISDDSLDTQFDFPAIHHEEIVSHDYKRHKRQVLYNRLREKYVLNRVNFRPHHGNRVLKKYIHRWILQCLIARFRERELRKVQMCVEK